MAQSIKERAQQATKMNGMPGGSSVSDPTGNIGVALADLMTRIQELEDQVDAGDDRIREFANSVEDERIQMAIQMRYISCMTWTEVAEILCFKSETGIKNLLYRRLGADGVQLRIEEWNEPEASANVSE